MASVDSQQVFIGVDGGATTTKIGAVWQDTRPVSTELLQRPTGAGQGPVAVMEGWAAGVDAFLASHQVPWSRVAGVGAAMPGPQRSYGVLERGPNLPESFVGFDVLAEFGQALAATAGRTVPLVVGNDGNMGGVAEAQRVRGDSRATVLMLAPGSGLGCAYVDAAGLPLDGDTLAGMEASHMPAPLHLLNAKPYTCGCGRTWGCFELYTSLAGLPMLLADRLAAQPAHPLASSPLGPKERALALRGLAQQGDPLAVELFDFQAKAMGLHIANLVMALDPEYVVIGGGLMDPGATTSGFRERYLRSVRESAAPYLWPTQRQRLKIVPAVLGELSQAIGAALVALYRSAR
jgi:glucokinase